MTGKMDVQLSQQSGHTTMNSMAKSNKCPDSFP